MVEAAKEYFQSVRPEIIDVVPEEALREHDLEWQEMIRLASGNNLRQSFVKRVAALKKRAIEIDVYRISGSRSGTTNALQAPLYTQEEMVLIQTLTSLVPSAAQSYEQAIQDLTSMSPRVSYRGTATELREAFRETLDQLAPDDAVTQQVGFALEKGRTQPTMKQKVRFILRSRGKGATHRTVAEKSLELIEALGADIARAFYDRGQSRRI
ncbi:MAG: hypothetical protein H0V56_10660 [Chthoniobacterales bacterium]|nr:hypothetical protein [Chthoniobacterales bacterium]